MKISLVDEEDISSYLLDSDRKWDEEQLAMDNSDASGSSTVLSATISDIKRLWTQQQYLQSILLENPVSSNDDVQKRGDMVISAMLSDETATLAGRLNMLGAHRLSLFEKNYWLSRFDQDQRRGLSMKLTILALLERYGQIHTELEYYREHLRCVDGA